MFTDTIEIILYAAYARRADKLAILQKACVKLDALQFFLQLAWELNVLDNRKYGAISTPLAEVGKMLGGWKKQFTKDAPNKPGAPRA
ncbi:MAG: four helix bundle protein [Candidatus Kerfeldbacteria bacterium]